MNINVASVDELPRPFPGLRPFDYREHEFYFGRIDQIYALYRLLDLSRFVAVVGSSGSGKSSLVFAGLRPLLDKDTAQPGGRNWIWSEMSPKNAPIEGLIDLVQNLARDCQPDLQDDPAFLASQRSRIAYLIRLSSRGLVDALAEIEGLKDKTLVLVVDQFEELFRYAKPSQRRDPVNDSLRREEAVLFVQLLLGASRDARSNARIVLTMRSDFIGDCASFRGLPEAVSGTQFLVPGLSREQFEEAIRKPIEICRSTIKSGVVERLLNDISDETDQLPVLQHCLLRLWEEAGKPENRADGVESAAPAHQPIAREITVDHYNAVGRIAGALSQHADEILRGLPGLEPIVERVFRALSEVDKEGRAIRRKLTFAELLKETCAQEQDLRKALDRFRTDDCSFLRPTQSDTATLAPDTPIDVGHEALLRRWKKVCGDPGATEEKKDERSIGWLRTEDKDARHYQSLVFIAGHGPADPEPLPHSQVKENWDWWCTNPPRTQAWAERYGEAAGYGRVQRLLEISRAAFDSAEARQRSTTRIVRGAVALVCLLLVVSVELGAMFYAQRQSEQDNYQTALQSTRSVIGPVLDALNSGNISTTAAKQIATLLETNLNNLQQLTAGDSILMRSFSAIARIFGVDLSQNAQSSEIKSTRVNLLLTLSDVFATLGDRQQANAQAQAANDLANQLAAADPGNAAWRQLQFSTLFRIGDIYVDPGPFKNIPQGLALYQQAQAIMKSLVAESPNDGDRLYNLAFIDGKVGETLLQLNEPTEAMAQYNDALQNATKVSALQSAEMTWKTCLPNTLTKIGRAQADDGEWDQAIAKYTAAIAAQEDLLKDPSVNNDTVLSNLAASHRLKADALAAEAATDSSKFASAFTEYDAAVTLAKQLVDKDAGNAQWLTLLAVIYKQYGSALQASGDGQGALAQYKNELGMRQKLVNKDKTNAGWQKSLATTQANVDALTAALAQANAVPTGSPARP